MHPTTEPRTEAGFNTASGRDPYTIPSTKPAAVRDGTMADPYSGTGTHVDGSTTTGHSTNPVKNMLAAVHGVGEKVRGEFNGRVDAAMGEREGVRKNAAIANAGDAEIQTGQFSHATKNREGVVPGDGERRF